MSIRAVRSSQSPRVAASALAFALFLAGQFSNAASPEIASKVDRLIDVSGLAHTARQVLPGMLSGIDPPQQGVPANVRSALRAAATQAFQPEPMIERIRTRLGAALTAGHLDDTLAWLDSPLGRRLTAAENEVAEPAALTQMQAYGRQLEKRPPAKHRVGLIEDLTRTIGATEVSATILEGTILASALGLNAAQPVQQQVSPDVLRQRVKSSLPEFRQQTDQVVTLSLFYAYRSMSDREIESYLKFLKSPSGAAYSKVATEALSEAILEAIGRFMVALPKALDKYKSTTST